MLLPRSRRPALLIACTMGLLGFMATSSADAGGTRDRQAAAMAQAPASTSPRVGEPLNPSTPQQQALADHLQKQGAIFYGAWWCPACFQQKNLFGKEAGNRLPYVECDKTDDGRAVCMAAKIRAFPTWELAGKPRLEGVQTIAELKVWSGYQSGGDHSQH